MVNELVSFQRALALAQVRSGAGDWAEAARLWEQVVAANPVNGSYWASLAAARFAAADYLAAVDAYRRVLDLGVRPAERAHEMFPGDMPYLIPGEVAYSIACCYARLGEADSAIGALGAALDTGFRDLDRPQSDEHWKPLLADQRVRGMLGIVDAAGMSRDEGWQADLEFFAREVIRRAYAPFAEVTQESFSQQVAELNSQIPRLTDLQIMVELARLVRQFGDGHAFVIPAKADLDQFLALPLDVYRFDEGTYVTAVAAGYRDILGARIDRVGEHDTAAVIEVLSGILSRDNDQQVRFSAPGWLRLTPVLHALGLIEDPGEAMLTVTLPGGSAREVAVTAEPAQLGRMMPPYPDGWIDLPDTLTLPRPLYLRHRELPYRRGALFVIIGRLTFSAAQNIATALEEHTQATFVGGPTGSRPNFIGETIPFELPVSKLQVNVADLYWQTGHPMDHRPWIAPQLYAPPAFASFSQNRDPALTAILAASELLPGT